MINFYNASYGLYDFCASGLRSSYFLDANPLSEFYFWNTQLIRSNGDSLVPLGSEYGILQCDTISVFAISDGDDIGVVGESTGDFYSLTVFDLSNPVKNRIWFNVESATSGSFTYEPFNTALIIMGDGFIMGKKKTVIVYYGNSAKFLRKTRIVIIVVYGDVQCVQKVTFS